MDADFIFEKKKWRARRCQSRQIGMETSVFWREGMWEKSYKFF